MLAGRNDDCVVDAFEKFMFKNNRVALMVKLHFKSRSQLSNNLSL